MAVHLKMDRYGQTRVDGVSGDFRRYENGIVSGRIACPFTIVIKNGNGDVVSRKPVALTPNGKPVVAVNDMPVLEPAPPKPAGVKLPAWRKRLQGACHGD